jgi:hypothetical protein
MSFKEFLEKTKTPGYKAEKEREETEREEKYLLARRTLVLVSDYYDNYPFSLHQDSIELEELKAEIQKSLVKILDEHKIERIILYGNAETLRSFMEPVLSLEVEVEICVGILWKYNEKNWSPRDRELLNVAEEFAKIITINDNTDSFKGYMEKVSSWYSANTGIVLCTRFIKERESKWHDVDNVLKNLRMSGVCFYSLYPEFEYSLESMFL